MYIRANAEEKDECRRKGSDQDPIRELGVRRAIVICVDVQPEFVSLHPNPWVYCRINRAYAILSPWHRQTKVSFTASFPATCSNHFHSHGLKSQPKELSFRMLFNGPWTELSHLNASLIERLRADLQRVQTRRVWYSDNWSRMFCFFNWSLMFCFFTLVLYWIEKIQVKSCACIKLCLHTSVNGRIISDVIGLNTSCLNSWLPRRVWSHNWSSALGVSELVGTLNSLDECEAIIGLQPPACQLPRRLWSHNWSSAPSVSKLGGTLNSLDECEAIIGLQHTATEPGRIRV
jgi:hypothetical protein